VTPTAFVYPPWKWFEIEPATHIGTVVVTATGRRFHPHDVRVMFVAAGSQQVVKKPVLVKSRFLPNLFKPWSGYAIRSFEVYRQHVYFPITRHTLFEIEDSKGRHYYREGMHFEFISPLKLLSLWG